MRWIKDLIAYLVGILFIFSGTIKLIDPKGFGIKLEEYFEVFSTDFASFFHVFIPAALYLAIFVCVLEVMLGIALILKFRMKLTSWLLLLLILFFTALTFYSAYFNKVTDCGCFGDAIPLTPWQSFSKDVILLVLILVIFAFRNKYTYAIGKKLQWGLIAIGLVISLWIPLYALRHLPLIDFRPYKVGANIAKNMQPSAAYQYEYIMTKDGKEYAFNTYPKDTSYTYKNMILLNPEAQPKITDYSIWNEDGEYTEESFNGRKLFIVFHDVNHSNLNNLGRIKTLLKDLEGTSIEVWLITSNDAETFENFRHEYQLAFPYYYADHTVLKAMIRSNPGIMLLEDGVVKGKWHHNDTPEKEDVLSKLGQKASP